MDKTDPPCWDDEAGEGHDRHEFDGLTCKRCGYEMEFCAAAVEEFSYDYGSEWTACEAEVAWRVNQLRAVPFVLCNEHRKELDNDAEWRSRLLITSIEPYSVDTADPYYPYKACWEHQCYPDPCPERDERCK